MLSKIAKILSNGQLIAAIAAWIGAIVAVVSLLHTKLVWKKQKESGRPIITLGQKPGIVKQQGVTYLNIPIINVGVRPAYDLIGKIYIMVEDLNEPPASKIDFSVANPIPPKATTPWYSGFKWSRNMLPHYIVLGVKYKDRATRETLREPFYMKWGGVKDGAYDANILHASVEEKERIRNYLKQRSLLQDFEDFIQSPEGE